MKKNLRYLFERFKKLPFPELGKTVGEFPLYDGLLAGTVSSLLAGVRIQLDEVPSADQEAEKLLKSLKKKRTLDERESAFVRYADSLEELRAEAIKAAHAAGAHPASKAG